MLAYRGLWQDGTNYSAGDAVAYSGSLWVARADGLLERPNLDPDGCWQLAVKRGRSGRDGKDLAR